MKDKLLRDLGEIKDPVVLNQVFEFLQFLNRKLDKQLPSNRQAVLSFAGTLNAEDAKAMQTLIDQEFENIEGDW